MCSLVREQYDGRFAGLGLIGAEAGGLVASSAVLSQTLGLTRQHVKLVGY